MERGLANLRFLPMETLSRLLRFVQDVRNLPYVVLGALLLISLLSRLVLLT